MQQYSFVKRHWIFSTLISLLILSALVMIAGIGMGGDLLDGFAGGPRENTYLESTLIYGGFIAAISSFALIIAMVAYVIVRYVFRANRQPTDRKVAKRILGSAVALVLVGVLLVLSMLLFSWGIW